MTGSDLDSIFTLRGVAAGGLTGSLGLAVSLGLAGSPLRHMADPGDKTKAITPSKTA